MPLVHISMIHFVYYFNCFQSEVHSKNWVYEASSADLDSSNFDKKTIQEVCSGFSRFGYAQGHQHLLKFYFTRFRVSRL